jgi:hypothetical protein
MAENTFSVVVYVSGGNKVSTCNHKHAIRHFSQLPKTLRKPTKYNT